MSSNNKIRAKRRVALARMKEKAKRIYWFATPEWAAKLANNLKKCSRHCCGNRRKYEGPTRQERQNRVQDTTD